ncbi:MAG TPA: type II secretion system minor pseudopilin GspK [Deltaproteobacteria bacterium]|jgi:general secretion pathway protein K|nr:type II secretion system minor pseudopilin GspK [Deltaproteobacteria bacterium]HOI07477.1 type II secretion system minor pseudopilin GspK [Deltaproteobacteria bacterium]
MRGRAAVLKDRRGMVLLLVLATIALFAVMVVNFSADEGLDMQLAYNFHDSMQAQYIARSGVEAAIAMLKKDDLEYDADDEDWADFAQYAEGASQYLDGLHFSGNIIDESGRFDLNSIARGDEQAYRIKQFRNLFKLLDIDITESEFNELVRCLKDWMDKDDETDGTGAESDYYESLEKPYLCKNGPLDTPEEILLVKGMKPEYYYGTDHYKGIRDYVTVWSGGPININTASDIVLMSVSDVIDDRVVADIKAGRPWKQGSSNWARTLGFSGNPDEMQWINTKVFTNRSNAFRADMKGSMPSGARMNIMAILHRVQNTVDMVYYKIY